MTVPINLSGAPCRYGELEEVVLGESLAAVRLPDLEDDLDSSASSLSSFAATTESALSAALERCRQATGPSLTVILTQRSKRSQPWLHEAAGCAQHVPSHFCLRPIFL